MNERKIAAGGSSRSRLRRLAAALVSAAMAAVALPMAATAPAEATTYGCPTGWYVQSYYSPVTSQSERYCIGEFADTVGTKSWTVPPGVTSAEIMVVGGGGGGGSSYVGSGKRYAGGGGGGGNVLHRTISVTPADTWTITTGAGGAASSAGSASSVVKGGTTYSAAGGTAGADATSSGAGAGGGSAVTLFSASKVTYTGGTVTNSGSNGAAGGGAGAGQKYAGASAEIAATFKQWQSQISINAINWGGPDWAGLTSGYGGNGYTVSMAPADSIIKAGYNYWDGSNRTYYFGAGGGGGKVGDKVDELTAQGGNAEFGDAGSQPAGRGGSGSNTGTAESGQDAKPHSGGGGGGGGAAGTVNQAGGAGSSGLVVIVYVAYVAALDLFESYDTEAGFDAWNAGSAATPLTLSPGFSADNTKYSLYIDPLATTLWLATSPFEDLGRVAVTASGPEVVTSPSATDPKTTAWKIQGIQVGTSVITVKAYSRDDVAVETYTFKIKVPITPPDPGSRALAWGYASDGSIGDNQKDEDRTAPVLVSDGANTAGTWSRVDGGYDHSCGLGMDNKAYCWGDNYYYQLGDGTSTGREEPVVVSNGDNTAGTFKTISVGLDNTCGMGTDNKAYCWGYNYYGEVGNNGVSNSDDSVAAPALVANGENASGTWKAVYAGYYAACGIGGDDSAYCWGYDTLGAGDGVYEQKTPVKVHFPDGTKVTSIALNDYSEHACAIADDSVWCWGDGDYGELGDDLKTSSTVPVEIALPLAYANAKPIQVAIGAYHSLMVAEFTETKVAPGAPTISTITPLDGAADVEFTAGKDGTAPVTNYQYRLGTGPWRTLSPADTTSPIRIPGLTNFTEYSITIRAVSADGNSPASNAVKVTPVGPFAPGAPTISSAKPLDGAAEVRFTPGKAGSAETTNYQYRLGNGQWTSLDPASTTSPLTIPGLTNGTTYTIRIRAVSADGKSLASNSVTVTPKGPGVPKPVPTEIKPGKGEVLIDGKRVKVTIEVNADKTGVTLIGPGGLKMELSGEGADGSALPVDTDGALILVREGVAQVSGTGFKAASVVKLYLMSKPTLIGTTTTDGTGTFAGTGDIPAGLKAGSHVIQAVGVTSSGKTLNLSIAVKLLPEAAAGAPSKVQNLVVKHKLAAQKKAILDWTPPATGSATKYIVAYRSPGAVDRWVKLVTTERTGYIIRGAQPGCRYDVRVAAVNGEGRGPWETLAFSMSLRARSLPAGDLVCRLP